MDLYDDEFISFWKALGANSVRYIMVGGFATNMNGYQRTTDDIDVWFEDSIENREKMRFAFRDYGMGDFFMFPTLQIIPGWTNFNLNNGVRLDLMVDMKGLEGFTFDECYLMSNKADIDGIIVPFLHINHLIANKKAVNRPKDQLDVIYLEKIKKLREEEGL
jgi:hypothetical protein